MRQEIFRMERVTYVEKEVTQLEDFNIQIYQGEIMGLVPINGHGLQAFLQLLQSNLSLEDGFVYYGEELINSWRGGKKGYNRISIIENKSCLVERMTVADNIFVLRQGFRQHVVRPSLLRRQMEPFFREIEMDISADTYVENLTYFERVVVELVRGVIMGHRLIVLNEINTLISEKELGKLYAIMQKYISKGFSFLYISPHFDEVAQVCDRVALLSYGRIKKIMDETEMAQNMLQQYPEEYHAMLHGQYGVQKQHEENRDIVLEFRQTSCGVLKRLNIKVYEGESVVIQSMDHNVFCTLTDLLSGDIEIEGGQILVSGKEAALPESRDVAVIKEQPTQNMIFKEMSYMDNLCFGLARRIPDIWVRRHIRESIRREYKAELGEEVFLMSPEELTEKQKYQLVYMRVLLQRPKVVFCVQPFKGADMPHRMYVWEMLKMLLEKGIAVVILAVNLADSMAISDRLLRIDGNSTVVEISQKEFFMAAEKNGWQIPYKKEYQAE